MELSVEYHEKKLAKLRACLDAEEQALKESADKIAKLRSEAYFYEYQIREARREGKKKFEPQTYRSPWLRGTYRNDIAD